MSMHKRVAITALSLGMALTSLPTSADEDFKLLSSNNARKLLVHQHGKVVTLQLNSGKELTGTVTTVGEFMVHLSRLSGRDFYDAAVSFDQIEAVIVKARSK